MPLSDLTGTKWVLNNNPSLSGDYYFYINFTSQGQNYTSFAFSSSGNINYNGFVPYYDCWMDNEARTISITGGTDATNADLISWLQANATQVEVTDLSGTEWEFNASVTVDEETYSINFVSNNNNYTELQSYAMYSGTITFGQDFVYYGNSGGWTNSAYKSISITSGTDTTNPDLIAWLSTNATYQAPVVGNVYEITHSLTNLTHGNVSFTITPDTGYALPSSVSVTNGTLVSYDSSTGVVVVSGDSVEISVSCEAASVGYEVEIIGAGGHFERIYVQLNDDPTWYYAQMLMDGGGFGVLDTNIPNAYTILQDFSIGIANISKIKIGTDGNPANYTGPKYISGSSTGDFANLTFTSTGGSAPAYATGKITMTQDSTICFEGDD